MMEKKKISLPIIVEGKYDKATLAGLFDCTVISVGDFGIFNSQEKQALLRRLCADGAIVLTDSDGGGVQIRSFLSGILPKDKIYHAYIPRIEGKEKRKTKAGKAGLLGVEGMSRETLERALAPFIDNGGRVEFSAKKEGKMLTKVDFFEHGLTGAVGSAERRDRLSEAAGLPTGMTPNALLEAMNLLYPYDEAIELMEKV
jgi:ribonuclease M5